MHPSIQSLTHLLPPERRFLQFGLPSYYLQVPLQVVVTIRSPHAPPPALWALVPFPSSYYLPSGYKVAFWHASRRRWRTYLENCLRKRRNYLHSLSKHPEYSTWFVSAFDMPHPKLICSFSGVWAVAPNHEEIFIPASLLHLQIDNFIPMMPSNPSFLSVQGPANVPTIMCTYRGFYLRHN